MAVHDVDVDAEALRSLGLRIEGHLRDLRTRGEFSGIAAAAIIEAGARRDLIQERLDKALQEGKPQTIIMSEIRRDFNGVLDDLADFAHRLDTEAMKQREEDIVPPKSA